MAQNDNFLENSSQNDEKSFSTDDELPCDYSNSHFELFRSQIKKVSSFDHTKPTIAIDNLKIQITDFIKRIEDTITHLKEDVIELENKLLDIQDNVPDKNISFFQEILRKTIHFLSLSIPISYLFFPKENILMVLVPLMLAMIIFDISTKKNAFLRAQYLRIFGFMLRKHEIRSNELFLNGASWVLISSVITIYFFPPLIAVIGLSVLFISDVIAAIFGRRYGKRRFLNLKNKSIVGTTAFAVSAFLIASI